MTKDDRLFLRQFRSHVIFFLKKKRITKKRMLYNLKEAECPFSAEEFDEEIQSRFLAIRGRKIVHRDMADESFRWNMWYDWNHLVPQMKKLIREVRV